MNSPLRFEGVFRSLYRRRNRIGKWCQTVHPAAGCSLNLPSPLPIAGIGVRHDMANKFAPTVREKLMSYVELIKTLEQLPAEEPVESSDGVGANLFAQGY